MESRVGIINTRGMKPKVTSGKNIAKYEIAAGICGFLICIGTLAMDIVRHENVDGLTNLFTYMMLTLLFLIFDGWLVYVGIRTLHDIRHFRAYVEILQKDETGSIRRLAADMKESYSDTVEHLKKFSDRGYFCNIVIDESLERIQFPERMRKYSDSGYETVTCEGCGATKLLPKNEVVKCEYCGNILRTGK